MIGQTTVLTSRNLGKNGFWKRKSCENVSQNSRVVFPNGGCENTYTLNYVLFICIKSLESRIR